MHCVFMFHCPEIAPTTFSRLGHANMPTISAAHEKSDEPSFDRFFDSDDATKAICSYEASPAFRGYMRLGVENTAGVVDAREQIELGREDGICDGVAQRLVFAATIPDAARSLAGYVFPFYCVWEESSCQV